MSDGFSDMIQRANGFFTELKANNTKDFYEPRKAFYRDEIKKPAELFGDLFAEDLSRHTGKPHGSKLFRIHRDVRFSKDKTPYNAHLHLMWKPPSDGPVPVWFFGASPDYIILGMGLPGLQGPDLTRFRALVDRDGDEVTDAMDQARETLGAEISDWGPPALKRVPKPYDQDHPHGALLKRKALTLSAPLPDGWQADGLLPCLNRMVPAYLPLWSLFEGAFPAK